MEDYDLVGIESGTPERSFQHRLQYAACDIAVTIPALSKLRLQGDVCSLAIW